MIRTRTMFFAACDICDLTPEAWDGIVAWTDEASALEMAQESGWIVKDGRHYCERHFICEASGCHTECGPLAGERDYLCDAHALREELGGEYVTTPKEVLNEQAFYRVERAERNMRAWMRAHPEADTQGLTADEWYGLALAALREELGEE